MGHAFWTCIKYQACHVRHEEVQKQHVNKGLCYAFFHLLFYSAHTCQRTKSGLHASWRRPYTEFWPTIGNKQKSHSSRFRSFQVYVLMYVTCMFKIWQVKIETCCTAECPSWLHFILSVRLGLPF